MSSDDRDRVLVAAREVVREVVLDRWSDFTSLPPTVALINEAFDQVLERTVAESRTHGEPPRSALVVIAEQSFRRWEADCRRRY